MHVYSYNFSKNFTIIVKTLPCKLHEGDLKLKLSRPWPSELEPADAQRGFDCFPHPEPSGVEL